MSDLVSRVAELEAENHALKLAAAGGEDVPGSASMVTPADVEQWREETCRRERQLEAENVRLKQERHDAIHLVRERTREAEEAGAENVRLIALLRAIYAGGTFADDFEDWQGLQQDTRAAGIAFGQNKAATKVAKAMGWELPIGPPSKARPTAPATEREEG